MNKRFFSIAAFATVTVLGLASLTAAGADSPAGPTNIRLLVITGGHSFEREPFLSLFKSFPDVSFEAVEHPQAQARFTSAAAASYDVIVFYDMYQKIDDGPKANLVQRLKDGKGLLTMHHALADYQNWPEFAKIIGGRYHLEKRTVDGVARPASTYKHGVDFTVKVEAADHPVTRGLADFKIHDETYGMYDVYPGVTPLLTTTEPTSSPTLCWAKTYEQARLVTLQLGHDHFAYENPAFRRLVHQAIRWVAKKD